MATRRGRPVNVLKEKGMSMSKRRTRAMIDQTRQTSPRADVEQQQRDPRYPRAVGDLADTPHPSQHGGIRADDALAEELRGLMVDRSTGGRRTGAGHKGRTGRRKRAAVSPDPRRRMSGGRSRTGSSRTGARSRRRSRSGTRTRSR